MKRIIIFLVFIVFVFGVYYIKTSSDSGGQPYSFREDFDTLNNEFWYVGEWKTMFSAYEKAKLNNGIIKLEIDEVDQGPFLLSKPLTLENGQVLTVKRRVRLTHTDDNFTGGFALIETGDEGVIPSALNNSSELIGNGIVLIEYMYGIDSESVRPGNNKIRILPRTWMIDDNYALAEPIFSKWFEEELVYDTNEQTVSYTVDGDIYTVLSQEMIEERFRVYMHGYGFGTGHSMEVDWIEISIE